MKRRRQTREGVVLVVVLVLLAAVASVMASLTWNSVAQRRFLAQREHQLQTEWLARGGLERAHAQQAAGKLPKAGSWRPLGERAEVKVESVPHTSELHVKCEATFPLDEPNPVTRVVEGIVRTK